MNQAITKNLPDHECPPSTAAAVANEFLNLGTNEPSAPAIDQMKLQKLLFYAHAWHLAFYDKPLFEEDFEAWPWGPVVRDVYAQTRIYGNKPINSRISNLSRTGSGPGDFSFTTPPGVEDPNLKAFIKLIWDTHKNYTGIQLSNSTHANNEPWSIVKHEYGNLDSKPNIPNELIMSVFKKKLQDASN